MHGFCTETWLRSHPGFHTYSHRWRLGAGALRAEYRKNGKPRPARFRTGPRYDQRRLTATRATAFGVPRSAATAAGETSFISLTWPRSNRTRRLPCAALWSAENWL